MRIFHVFIFCFVVLNSSAQEKHGFIFQRYDKSDGLQSNTTKNIAQDAKGFIWIATGNSLQRFDGHYFRTYTTANEPNLLSNDISSVYCDSQNRLWIYYKFKGLGLWDLNTGEKQNFTPDLNDNTSLPDHRVFDIYEDQQGTIWLSIHLKGIARYNEQTQDFKLFNIDRIVPVPEQRGINTVRTMVDHPTEKDKLLIGSFNGFLLLNKQTGDVSKFPISKANAENPSEFNGYENVILDIYIQNDSTLWIATFGGGILRYDLNTETFRSIKKDSAFPANPVKNNFHQISKKDENSLWVTIWNKGLFILDLETETLEMVNKKADGLSELSTALKLLKGKFGHLWMTSDQGLIKMYTEGGFTDYKYIGYSIEDVEKPDKNNIVILPKTSDHVNIYDKNWTLIRKVSYEPVRKFDLNFLEGIHQYKGQFFIQGFEGLYSLNSSLTEIKPVQPFFEQLEENGRLSIISSFVDSMGNLWMGTKVKGIFRYDIPQEKLFHYSPYFSGSQPHTDRWIFNFYEDTKGMIWIGTEAGFCKFNLNNQQFTNFPYPENSKKLDNIYFKECIGFAENDNGNIWVGSRESGLGLFDRSDFSSPELILKSSDKLRNKLLNNIIDTKQNLYLQLNEGFTIVDKSTKQVNNFTKAFGVNQIHNITKNGQLVIGNGFASPSKLEYQNLPKPEIYVDELMIAGKNRVYDREAISIPFNKNSISIRFGILDFIEKERAQLQYSLKKNNRAKWSTTSSSQLLSFPYLENGNYLLKIRAISPTGEIWDTLDIPIEIVPMFWQKLWVQILLVLVILCLITLPVLYRYRQKRQREKLKLAYEKEISNLKRKALKAQVNPHFLFNSLNSIRLLVMKGNIDKASEGISTFSRLVRKILNHSEREVITLKEEIESAKEYIKLEQMRLNEPFEVELDVANNIELESITIPPMLIQPFLENAIWHGLRYKEGKGKLGITINQDSKSGDYIIKIRDNGIGREAARAFNSNTKKSYGIKISSERLKNFNHSKIDQIQIIDLKNEQGEAEGTLVEIRIKSK